MDTFGLYPSGTKVTDKPEILFARLDVKEVLEKAEKLHEAQAAQQEAGGSTEEEAAKRRPGIDIEPKAGDHL